MKTNPPKPASRALHFAAALLAGLWAFLCCKISDVFMQGLAGRPGSAALAPLLQQLFLILLLLAGFAVIARLVGRGPGPPSFSLLPKRLTSAQEWQRGVALGWGMALLSVLPVVLVGGLHPSFWLSARSLEMQLIALTAVLLGTLATELVFRGLVYVRLISAAGPTTATLFMALFYATVSGFRPNASAFSMAVTFLLALLFCTAYLRTHALWLAWGLHFGWNLAIGVLFGLPVGGDVSSGYIVTSSVSGPQLLTGGAYGPEAAACTFIVLLLAFFVLYRITRDYAWNYTHEPIIPKAYAAVIAPPAAHTEMEEAAAPAPLVQILSATPANPSTHPVIEQHLRPGGDRANKQ